MSQHPESPYVAPFPESYRASGLLLHLTSLPSPYGIGDVGPAAVKWIDKLSEAGQSWRRHCRVAAIAPWNFGTSSTRSTMPRRLRKCSITKLSRMWLVPMCMEPRRTRAAAVAFETILGFQLRGAALRFKPCIPPSWPRFELRYRHGSANTGLPWITRLARVAA
jgi:4-alpha-glucanotransferase